MSKKKKAAGSAHCMNLLGVLFNQEVLLMAQPFSVFHFALSPQIN